MNPYSAAILPKKSHPIVKDNVVEGLVCGVDALPLPLLTVPDFATFPVWQPHLPHSDRPRISEF